MQFVPQTKTLSQPTSFTTHLLTQYESAIILQSKVRKWKKRDATLQALYRQKSKRDRRAAIKIQRAYRVHLAVNQYIFICIFLSIYLSISLSLYIYKNLLIYIYYSILLY
jgi:hypothetical protein